MSSYRRVVSFATVAAVACGIVSLSPPAFAARPRCLGVRATIVGSRGDNTIRGTRRDDVIVAKGGDDVVNGRGGDDLVCGGKGQDVLKGGKGADLLDGEGGGDRLEGGRGDDLLIGSRGDDRLLGDLGYDAAFYGFAKKGVTVNLATGRGRGQGRDRLRSIEDLFGSDHRDTLTGDDRAIGNQLLGGAGADVISGRGGEDMVFGEAGDDTLDGGAGPLDFVRYIGSTAPVTANLATGAAAGEGSDTLAGFEGIEGTSFGDVLTGDDGDNQFFGRGGDDTIAGAGGADAVRYDFLHRAAGNVEGVVADLSTGTSTGEGTDTFTGIEQIVGSRYDDTLTGDGSSNAFLGLAGDDDVAAGDGDDYLEGDEGTDSLDGGPGTDTCLSGENLTSCEDTTGTISAAPLPAIAARAPGAAPRRVAPYRRLVLTP